MIFEDIFKSILEQNFNTVEGDSTHAKAKRLSETLEGNLNFPVATKTLTRYYNQYIAETETKRQPDAQILKMLLRNIGYNSINEFKSSMASNPRSRVNTKRTWFFAAVLTVILAFGIYKFYEHEGLKCMAWNGTAYEECSCEENVHPQFDTQVLRITNDNDQLLNMRKIEVDTATVFFKNGEPIVWYEKNQEGEVEFFNMLGNHPENGETLKKVTEYIVNKYAR